MCGSISFAAPRLTHPHKSLLRLPLHTQTLSLTARRLAIAIPHLSSPPHPVPPRHRHVPGRTPSIPTSLTHVLPTHAQPLPSLHSRHTPHQPTTQQPTPAMSSGQRHGSSSSSNLPGPTSTNPDIKNMPPALPSTTTATTTGTHASIPLRVKKLKKKRPSKEDYIPPFLDQFPLHATTPAEVDPDRDNFPVPRSAAHPEPTLLNLIWFEAQGTWEGWRGRDGEGGKDVHSGAYKGETPRHSQVCIPPSLLGGGTSSPLLALPAHFSVSL